PHPKPRLGADDLRLRRPGKSQPGDRVQIPPHVRIVALSFDELPRPRREEVSPLSRVHIVFPYGWGQIVKSFSTVRVIFPRIACTTESSANSCAGWRSNSCSSG